MIYVICGLIGAGKTTYAHRNYKYVTDFDEIGSKEKQIQLTKRLHKSGKTVAHITCYPTSHERVFFDTNHAQYIWINTSPEQAEKNIKSRGRTRDIENIARVVKQNTQYIDKLRRSSIDFKIIDVF